MQEGECAVVSTEHCRDSWVCRISGDCTAKNGMCVVGSDADCRRSEVCKYDRKCTADLGWCKRR